MSKPTLPQILSVSIVAQSRLFNIEQVRLQFSNGVEREYERMKNHGRGAVMVVPFINDQTLLLIKEYACGTHSYELGFPKGMIDEGESPQQAANRELKEEIGYGANKFISLKSLAMAPTYFGSTMHVFIAQDLYPERLEGDEPEELEVVEWPLQQVDELLDNDDFSDGRCVAALLMADRSLKLSR
ncbi:MAG: ADP compounds hydrolase NudE [Gammaproteobacteria bacterium MedPE]|nr:MAG: ADP compounds hydrolase NudE [Gammaproteobacteria bacterium MedPE]